MQQACRSFGCPRRGWRNSLEAAGPGRCVGERASGLGTCHKASIFRPPLMQATMPLLSALGVFGSTLTPLSSPPHTSLEPPCRSCRHRVRVQGVAWIPTGRSWNTACAPCARTDYREERRSGLAPPATGRHCAGVARFERPCIRHPLGFAGAARRVSPPPPVPTPLRRSTHHPTPRREGSSSV